MLIQNLKLRLFLPVRLWRVMKLRQFTGWKPISSLEQTLTSMLKYWERAI
jgi:hypothetical protein